MNNSIKIGEEIMIDKGIFGIHFGKLLSVKGWSIGGFWGEYEDNEGNVRLFDETVHRVKKHEKM